MNEKEGVSYINYETHAIQIEHPLDEHFRQKFLLEKAKKYRLQHQMQNFGNQPNSEVQRVIDEQKRLLERELKESLEQVDKNFELKKKEILLAHEKELQIELQKWDLYYKEEERCLK